MKLSHTLFAAGLGIGWLLGLPVTSAQDVETVPEHERELERAEAEHERELERAEAEHERDLERAGDQDQVIVVEDRNRETARSSSVSGTRPNWETIGFGLGVFGLSYGAAVIAGSVSNHPNDDRLFIPLVGPWLAIAERDDCDLGQSGCDDKTRDKVLIGIDGVFQAAGALTAVIGLMSPVSYTVTTEHGARLEVGPRLSMDGPGLQLSGTF